MYDFVICKVIVIIIAIIAFIMSITELWRNKSHVKPIRKVVFSLFVVTPIVAITFLSIEFIEITAYILPLIVVLILLWLNRLSKQLKDNYSNKTGYSTLVSASITISVLCTIISVSFATMLILSYMTIPQQYPLNSSDLLINIKNIKNELEIKEFDYYSYLGRDTLDVILKKKPTNTDITKIIDVIITDLENNPKVTENLSQSQSHRLIKIILRYGNQEYFSAQFSRSVNSESDKSVFKRIYLTDINVNKLEFDTSRYEYKQ